MRSSTTRPFAQWDFVLAHLQHSKYDIVYQRGPTSFDLRAILHKPDNSRATSNKMTCKTTGSHDSKCCKKEIRRVKLVRHWNYYTTPINRLWQISINATRMVVWGFLHTIVPLPNQYVNGSKAKTIAQCFVCHSIAVFRSDLLQGRKCTLTHVCASKECIVFQCEIFQFGKYIFAD